jgi:hypothetical protein
MKNLNTVLPWYDTKAEQERYREDAERDCMVVANPSTVVPFLIRRVHSAGVVGDLVWHTYYKSNDVELLSDAMAPYIDAAGELTITTGTYYDYIIFDGSALVTALPKGNFYFKITDTFSSKDWYSETVRICDTSALTELGNPNYLRLQFSNDLQLSNIMAAFIQWMWVDAGLKAPEYLREDTGEKRDGLMVFEKRMLAKVDLLHLLAVNEYTVDALMLLPLMDNVGLYIDGVCYTYEEVQIKEPEWQEPLKGSLAKLEVRFVGDIIIKKLNFKEMGCNCSSVTGGSGTLKTGHGTGVITVPSIITFDGDPFGDNLYSISLRAWDAMNNPVDCPITNKLTTGFTLTPADNCSFEWTAIAQ